MLRRFSLSLVASVLLVAGAPAQATPGFGSNLTFRSSTAAVPRTGPFQTPPRLRGRVDFWKDIFAKYGRNQVVVHHREFPQVVFGVLDFSGEAESLGSVALARYREESEKATIAALKREIGPLAQGAEPTTPHQLEVARVMQLVPGGAEKYQRLIAEDLIRAQTGIRERYAEAIQRAWRYLPLMEQIFVSEYGLPKELTRIPFIESSFDYTAYSSVGAAGIWQFMPRTARAHRMLVGKYVDERRDPIKATRAAAEYLRSAFNSLGNWPLAITSYNHGVGGVRSKVTKAGTNDLAEMVEHPSERYFGFASSNFFPEFLAALEIFDDHGRYFPEVPYEPPLRVVSYPVLTPISVQHATEQLGIGLERLKEANYALLEAVWEGKAKIPAGYVLRVPVSHRDKLASLKNPETPSAAGAGRAGGTAGSASRYQVRRGDTLAGIARKFNLSLSELMLRNNLKVPVVQPGQLLVLGAPSQPATAPAVAQGGVQDSTEVYEDRRPVAPKRHVAVFSPKKQKSTAAKKGKKGGAAHSSQRTSKK
jgi:membrane-bound lytic murein transglycosylase D